MIAACFWCVTLHFPASRTTVHRPRRSDVLLVSFTSKMGGQSARGRNSVYIPPKPPSGEPYPLSPLILTSLIVLVYTLATMPLLPASMKQGLGPLSQRSISSFSQLGGKPQNQFQFSWDHILANIGAPAGAAPGAVIASPSKKDPDYFVSYPNQTS